MANRYNTTWEANPKRRPKRGCLSTAIKTVAILALVGAIGWYIWAQITMSNYQNLNSGSKIAQVCAFGTHYPHEINVQVTTFDKNEDPTSNPPQAIRGDILQLQGDIIKYPDPLPIVGLSSGYKLTRLEGHYRDPNNESQYGPMAVIINNGDDFFFTAMHTLPTPVEANHDTSFSVPVDSNTYYILLPQTGVLQISRALDQPGCGPHAKAAH